MPPVPQSAVVNQIGGIPDFVGDGQENEVRHEFHHIAQYVIGAPNEVADVKGAHGCLC